MLPDWLRDPRGSPVVLPFTYAAVLIASEAGLVQNHHVLAGAIIDAVLVLILVNAVQDPVSRGARFDAADAAMRALAVVALSRVIAIGLPLRDASTPLATLGVSLLVAGATVGIARVAAVPLRALAVPRVPRLQRGAALAGFVLGLLAYLLGAPRLWASGASPGRVFLGLLAALVAAVVEEFLFRGLLMVTLRRVAARAGVAASCALFAATYLGVGSPGLVLVIAIAGVVFAGVVARSGSLSGPLAGHVLLALGAGGLWPALFGLRHAHLGHSAVVIVLLALALLALGRSVWRAAAATAPGITLVPPTAPDIAPVPPTAPDIAPVPPTIEPVPSTAGAEPAPRVAFETSLKPAMVPATYQTEFPIDPSLPPSHVEPVLACMRRLGLPDLLGPEPERERDLCVAAISQLLLSPDSSRETALTAAVTGTMGADGAANSSVDELDAAMRWLGRRKARIEAQLAARHLEPDAGVPGYDLRISGDHIYGVLSTSRGLAVAVQRHAGDRRDPAALPAAVEALRARLRLSAVIVTCDERAASEADLSRLDRVPGWIVAVPVSTDGSMSLESGETLSAAGQGPDHAPALRVGGLAAEMGSEARWCYAEATAPELRFAPPPADSPASRNGALTLAMLAGYVAWHLRDAWAELNVLTHRLSEPALHVLALRLIDQRVPSQHWPESSASEGLG